MMKTTLTKNNAVVITAAGNSRRFGEKKEYQVLNKNNDSTITVLSQSLYAFVQTQYFTHYVITIPTGDKEIVEALLHTDKRLAAFLQTKPSQLLLTEGGASRQESVYAGLLQLEHKSIDSVLVHDGARPWVSGTLISAVLSSTEIHGAVVPIIPVTDTQKEIDKSGKIIRHLQRASIVAAQTPQGFRYASLLLAHRSAEHDGNIYTDDSEIYAIYCGDVYTCVGTRENKKITYPNDLEVVK